MSDRLRVHACIVAYGASPHLGPLVEQLDAAEGVDSISIVDNGAEIDSRLRAGDHTDCGVVEPGGNVGYAGGVAAAVAAAPADSEAYLVVNPDVVFDAAALDRFIEAHTGDRPAISSAPLVEHGRVGSNLRGATSMSREALKALVGSRAAWKFRAGSSYPSGALMLISRDAWDRLGGFDERFELYYEDVELVDRYLAAGERVVVRDEPVGEHVGGVSSGGTSDVSFEVLRISRLRYLRLRYGRVGAASAVALGLIEFPGQSIVRRAVSPATWWATMRSCVQESRWPWSVNVLDALSPTSVATEASSTPSVSVAMCTYNGGKFIAEQLASIASQTVLPLELVVCDDASLDHTVDVVRSWSATVPFPVDVIVNDETMGVGANFDQAIRRCRGDLIALSDQDDVWRHDRIGRQVATLAAHPDVGYCFADADLIDADSAPLPGRLWDRVGFRSRRSVLSGHRMLRIGVRRSVATGATMMIRRSVAEQALPIPPEWIHDHWITLAAGAADIGAFADARPVISYRLHAAQAAGLRSGSLVGAPSLAGDDDFRAATRRFEILADRLQSRPEPSSATARVEAKLDHLRRRRRARRPQRGVLVLAELLTLRYFRYSNGLRSALSDVAAPPARAAATRPNRWRRSRSAPRQER